MSLLTEQEYVNLQNNIDASIAAAYVGIDPAKGKDETVTQVVNYASPMPPNVDGYLDLDEVLLMEHHIPGMDANMLSKRLADMSFKSKERGIVNKFLEIIKAIERDLIVADLRIASTQDFKRLKTGDIVINHKRIKCVITSTYDPITQTLEMVELEGTYMSVCKAFIRCIADGHLFSTMTFADLYAELDIEVKND